ncbi:fumarylacetoacetate hydrolase [Vibrio cholerae]|nr:DUF2805 domain-containing protein [Vibrio cholerae]RGP90975.1 fumarylacetoacetate hydrolase [Vibrio cholerae]RGP95653.1 fumarylacetoacetate hydrolase [Vibrio cholerae]
MAVIYYIAMISHQGLIRIFLRFMRSRLNSSSFKLWRKRVSGRSTKHVELRGVDVSRGYCKTQYKHR